MRRTFAMALAILAVPFHARAAETGHVIEPSPLLAGPNTSDEIARVQPNEPITVLGCLASRSWCEVSGRDARGWVRAELLEVTWHGRHLAATDKAVRLPTVSTALENGAQGEQRSAGGVSNGAGGRR